MRLSNDDGLDGESNSIKNQRKILRQKAEELGLTRTEEYIDDGYSGTNFKRPGFEKLDRDIEAGRVAVVTVNNLSRLGRDYLQVGYLTEKLDDIFMQLYEDHVAGVVRESTFQTVNTRFEEEMEEVIAKIVECEKLISENSGDACSAESFIDLI